ncbi:hypothetical protein QFZ42_001228 [Variovorax paradoxus]|jgi:hypothetical protein|uniref:hypothetical protein n=1 Tax=Variovorax paradoxus TaxID=34073 RepID=UPI002791F2DB|nr:hypothetical protein [Variovorax paradoxus]MDQ0569394.1 hypothetical protein [Variovorax paradoxus]
MRRIALKLAAATMLAMVIAGCASGPTGPKFQEMGNVIPKIKSGDGRIYFFRAAGPFGAALQPGVRIDKLGVGSSKPGSFFFVDRPAGTYLAATTTDLRKTLAIPLAEGETKYVRMSPSFGLAAGSIVLDLEPAEKARAEMGWLAYAGQAIVNK